MNLRKTAPVGPRLGEPRLVRRQAAGMGGARRLLVGERSREIIRRPARPVEHLALVVRTVVDLVFGGKRRRQRLGIAGNRHRHRRDCGTRCRTASGSWSRLPCRSSGRAATNPGHTCRTGRRTTTFSPMAWRRLPRRARSSPKVPTWKQPAGERRARSPSIEAIGTGRLAASLASIIAQRSRPRHTAGVASRSGSAAAAVPGNRRSSRR